MDAKMPKLPAYVFRRSNGSYRYKRNVPKKLRHLIGKDTLYRQLGESDAEAMKVLPKVHSEIEALFAADKYVFVLGKFYLVSEFSAAESRR